MFYSSSKLRAVVIPSSVKEIGFYYTSSTKADAALCFKDAEGAERISELVNEGKENKFKSYIYSAEPTDDVGYGYYDQNGSVVAVS